MEPLVHATKSKEGVHATEYHRDRRKVGIRLERFVVVVCINDPERYNGLKGNEGDTSYERSEDL
jgi:hypothetical protein